MSGLKLNTDIFSRLSGRLTYLNARHDVMVQNIANLETPDYKSKDVEFQGYVDDQLSESERNLQTSFTPKMSEINIKGDAKPNGNTVSIEEQMAKMADNSVEYMVASEIFKKNLSLLKFSMSEGK